MDITQITDLPLIALRDVIVYPNMQMTLFIGREESLNAVQIAEDQEDGYIYVVAQKDSLNEDVDPDNLYSYGTICRIIQVLNHDEDCQKVLIEGLERAHLQEVVSHVDYMRARIVHSPLANDIPSDQQEALINSLKKLFADFANDNLRNARELVRACNKIEDLNKLFYFITARLDFDIETKQQFLDENNLIEHINLITTHMVKKNATKRLENELQEKVKSQMEKNQREYFLNEKMKAVKDELTELGTPGDDEVSELEAKIRDTKLPEEISVKCKAELRKLKMMPPTSAESGLIRTYIEALVDMPWYKRSRVSSNLAKAETVLNSDHYGLDEVKDRILEYLAVQSRVKKIRGSVLCLVGPPGVGKTSLGESIAKATGRKFLRMALGGVRDEAEIRGHRRTYIGAMPGKIAQHLQKGGVKNPLILLDEIDKMAQDFRGDPASALLEVLDPSQNSSFNDHYLDVDVDLSEVMFVCTSNSMDIPSALLDRMEIIRLPGYTEDEKVSIAENYLVPRALKDNGLKDNELSIEQDAVRSIVQHYTREAGVRNLAREISKVCRKVVKKAVIAQQTAKDKKQKADIPATTITPKDLNEYLGVYPFDYGLAEKEAQIGRVTGLAWTSVGGELLTIEAAAMQGKGLNVFTGLLGDVMKESIQAAVTLVRSRGDMLGIAYSKFKETDIHVHMPEGATPKDGPSAGIALTTAVTSVMTGIAIRPDIAMTGEVTLHGHVLRIGGLKEKLLAAHRGGITHVLIPHSNERDLQDIPDNVKEGLTITPVKTIDEVFEHALVSKPQPLVVSDTKPADKPKQVRS